MLTPSTKTPKKKKVCTYQKGGTKVLQVPFVGEGKESIKGFGWCRPSEAVCHFELFKN